MNVVRVDDTDVVVEGRLEEALMGSAVVGVSPEDVLVVDSLQDVEEALRGAAVLVEKVVGWGG